MSRDSLCGMLAIIGIGMSADVPTP